jgi:hypothetical protein
MAQTTLSTQSFLTHYEHFVKVNNSRPSSGHEAPSLCHFSRCKIECPLPSKPLQRPTTNRDDIELSRQWLDESRPGKKSTQKNLYSTTSFGGSLFDSTELTPHLERTHNGEPLTPSEQNDELFEEDILFDDNVSDHESLINLVEAQWELQEIFSGSGVPFADNGEMNSPFLSLGEEFDLPQLGPSPALEKPMPPPSRSHNPVPLNPDFGGDSTRLPELAVSHTQVQFLKIFGTSAATMYNSIYYNNYPAPNYAPLDLERRELSRHKRGRSYSDSMLRKDDAGEFETLTKGDSLVVVS